MIEPERLPSAVLVTGASTGIGYATTMRLARRGTIVYAGVRRQSDADVVVREGGERVRPLLLDVTDPAAIARAHETIAAARDVRLAGLVNNAGIVVAGPIELLPMDELRRQFDVNFFGAIALVQTFLPLLRQTRGRIVNVSSISGKFASPYVGAYAASKFALEAATDALRVELRPFGIGVALVEPGAVKTPIWERTADASLRMFETVPFAARALYDEMIRKVMRLSQDLERHGVPPERVALAIERALCEAKPQARYLVGNDARFQLVVARLPEVVRDRLVAARIGVPAKPPRERTSKPKRSNAGTRVAP
jgi:NAD(P)-dependent dehydrogenase (short-subunit alcohol dehydrogenase family)